MLKRVRRVGGCAAMGWGQSAAPLLLISPQRTYRCTACYHGPPIRKHHSRHRLPGELVTIDNIRGLVQRPGEGKRSPSVRPLVRPFVCRCAMSIYLSPACWANSVVRIQCERVCVRTGEMESQAVRRAGGVLIGGVLLLGSNTKFHRALPWLALLWPSRPGLLDCLRRFFRAVIEVNHVGADCGDNT